MKTDHGSQQSHCLPQLRPLVKCKTTCQTKLVYLSWALGVHYLSLFWVIDLAWPKEIRLDHSSPLQARSCCSYEVAVKGLGMKLGMGCCVRISNSTRHMPWTSLNSIGVTFQKLHLTSLPSFDSFAPSPDSPDSPDSQSIKIRKRPEHPAVIGQVSSASNHLSIGLSFSAPLWSALLEPWTNQCWGTSVGSQTGSQMHIAVPVQVYSTGTSK